MVRVVVLIFALISLIFQHLIHEYAHVLIAKMLGVKVVGIQWLTYKGGTRVFYENEPDFESVVPMKWAVIAGAGYFVTNVLGYIFTGIYLEISSNQGKAFLCILSVIFLMCDSLYFVLGSLFNFGDIVGVRKALKLSKNWSVILSLAILIFNVIVVKIMYY